MIKTAFKAPMMNSFAESFVGNIKRECLDYYFCVSLRQMDYIVRTYIKYYNTHRPHQGRDIGNRPLSKPYQSVPNGEIQSKEFLGGLLRTYYRDSA